MGQLKPPEMTTRKPHSSRPLVPAPSSVAEVVIAVEHLRDLLELHIAHANQEHARARTRDEAILSMLGEMITRLPPRESAKT